MATLVDQARLGGDTLALIAVLQMVLWGSFLAHAYHSVVGQRACRWRVESLCDHRIPRTGTSIPGHSVRPSAPPSGSGTDWRRSTPHRMHLFTWRGKVALDGDDYRGEGL